MNNSEITKGGHARCLRDRNRPQGEGGRPSSRADVVQQGKVPELVQTSVSQFDRESKKDEDEYKSIRISVVVC